LCRVSAQEKNTARRVPDKKVFDMDRAIVDDNWKRFKGKVKARGKLTDDRLAGKVQETYSITKDEIKQQINRLEELNKNWRPGSVSPGLNNAVHGTARFAVPGSAHYNRGRPHASLGSGIPDTPVDFPETRATCG
jgi:uncharacterized protein YjbJ (UPF0337 family)